MTVSGDQPERKRWRWPQFTILELLLVTTGLAALWGFLAGRHELNSGSVVGSFGLLWALLCWKTVRLNNHFFQSQNRDSADKGVQTQIPPSALRDAWFVVFPVLILAFYTHFFIYAAMRGTDSFSTCAPRGSSRSSVVGRGLGDVGREFGSRHLLVFNGCMGLRDDRATLVHPVQDCVGGISDRVIAFGLPNCLLYETAPKNIANRAGGVIADRGVDASEHAEPQQAVPQRPLARP